MSISGRTSDAPDIIDEPESAGAAAPSLWRNRNYNILWISLLFSMMGTELVAVAFPLLIIAHHGSPALIGLVTATLAVTRMGANIPAGIMADRWNRKRLMFVAQGMRGLSAAGLTVALIMGAPYLPFMFIAAAIEGIFGSVFEPTEHAVLPLVVASKQLSSAIARNSARPFVALLLGPAVAGLAFALRDYVPFLLDAVMLGVSFVAIGLLRLPRRVGMGAPAPGGDASSGGDAVPTGPTASGFRWILSHRVIRSTVIWMIFVNLAFNALIVVILAVSGENHVGSGNIGLMMACLGAGGIAGAIAAEPLAKHLRAPVIIIGATWLLAIMTTVMIITPSGILLGVVLGAAIAMAPVANTTIMTYQLVTAPADLRGRLSGVIGFCSDGAAVVGPVIAGILVVSTGHGSKAIAVCAGALVLIAIVTTLSKTMRHFPAISRADADAVADAF
jgi:MFS family permease